MSTHQNTTLLVVREDLKKKYKRKEKKKKKEKKDTRARARAYVIGFGGGCTWDRMFRLKT